MRARRANRPAVLVTTRDRMRAIHADAYTADENPRCATCHTDNCPRYQRIQDRLYQQHLARVALLPADTYTEEPW
ncbi:hypothetical protein [Streptomyces sp. AcH 505]|uniref:hypothetical protein n=1 Tax=Streptomyces sp. AcH 505 TaxID=352211 RepID=UPI0018E2D4DF